MTSSAMNDLSAAHQLFSRLIALPAGHPHNLHAAAQVAAEAEGLAVSLRRPAAATLPDLAHPFILGSTAGPVLILGRQAGHWQVERATDGITQAETWDDATLHGHWNGDVLIASPRPAADTRGKDWVASHREHWLWPVLWRYRHIFIAASLFSLLINILALSTTVFVMSVYDRIVPNQAYVTLWSLGLGVLVAVVLEFIAREARSHALDRMGRQVDVILSTRIFARALARPLLAARKGSTGSTAATLREFDAVREFVASATLTALADLPFVVLFLLFIGVVAGPLVWIPILIFILTLSMALLVQIPLARLGRESLLQSVTRQGIAVECIDGIETLKALGGEPRMVERHAEVAETAADIALRTRTLSNTVGYATSLMLQIATVVTLIWGTYLVGDGELTLGALIAAVMLNGRVLGPLQTIAGLATRLQQTRLALSAIDQLMNADPAQDAGLTPIRKTTWGKTLTLENVQFGYNEGAPPVLQGVSLTLNAGDRVACLGRIGSGKSTLLKVLCGLHPAREGLVRLDGISLAHADNEQLRQAVGYVPQDSRLFLGTLRENLLLGAGGTSDERLLALLTDFGLANLVATHPLGLDMPVSERGENFSGGLRQAIALARALLRSPAFLLLDEPTSAMDMQTERIIMNALARHAAERGIGYLIVTHRPALLDYVDRMLVIDSGTVAANGPKTEVMRLLSGGKTGEPHV